MYLSGGDARLTEIERKFEEAQRIDPTATEFLDFSTADRKLHGAAGLAPRLCALVTGKGGAIVGCYDAHRTELRRARDRIPDLYEKHRGSFDGHLCGTYLYKPRAAATNGVDLLRYEEAEAALTELLQETTGRRPEIKEYDGARRTGGRHAGVLRDGGFLIENEGGGGVASAITWIDAVPGSEQRSQGGSSGVHDSLVRSGHAHSNKEL